MRTFRNTQGARGVPAGLTWLMAVAASAASPSAGVATFEEVDATHGRVIASIYLARQGLTLSGITPGTLVVIDNARNIYDGRALVAPSAPNVLTQINSNDPVTFTLNFPGGRRRIPWNSPRTPSTRTA